MAEVISLRFKYTEDEYAAASRLNMMRSPGFWIWFVVSSLFCALGVYFVSILSMDLGILFFVWLMLWLLQLFVVPRQAFRREPKFRDEYLLQFSDDGIQFVTPQIDALIQWSLYTRVIESERFYLLVYGRNMMSVIPKRAFASVEQQNAFGAMLRRRLPGCFDPKRLCAEPPVDSATRYVTPSEPPDWR
jgi:hypothetical protein